MSGVSLDGNGETLSLNLYPILDIFSILICFLLMNFSTQSQSVETGGNLELPISEVKMSLDEAASVSVSQKDVTIQGGVSIPLMANGDVSPDQVDQGALKVAYQEFKKLKTSQETLKNRDKSLSLNNLAFHTLTLEADKKAKFQILKRIMLSGQQAEFISWKLAVSRAEVN